MSLSGARGPPVDPDLDVTPPPLHPMNPQLTLHFDRTVQLVHASCDFLGMTLVTIHPHQSTSRSCSEELQHFKPLTPRLFLTQT